MTDPTVRRRSQYIDAAIDEYSAVRSSGPDHHQLELQRVTQEHTGGFAGMQIGDDQALLMEMLVRAMGAKRAVEWERSRATPRSPSRAGSDPTVICCVST